MKICLKRRHHNHKCKLHHFLVSHGNNLYCYVCYLQCVSVFGCVFSICSNLFKCCLHFIKLVKMFYLFALYRIVLSCLGHCTISFVLIELDNMQATESLIYEMQFMRLKTGLRSSDEGRYTVVCHLHSNRNRCIVCLYMLP